MIKTLPRQKANQRLSRILWNRKFKPTKNIAIVSGVKMSDEDFEKYSNLANQLKNANRL